MIDTCELETHVLETLVENWLTNSYVKLDNVQCSSPEFPTDCSQVSYLGIQ